MVFKKGAQVFAVSLPAFGYVFTQGTTVFAAVFCGSTLLLVLGAIWWLGSRRLSVPANGAPS